jgi:type IV pilus assembly protein PilW
MMKKEQRLLCGSQLGIGLIELMVSMLIGLFVMAGVLQMFSTTTQNAAAVAGSSRIQENIRYAFSRITQDVSQSGNLGCLGSSMMSRYSKDNTSLFRNNLGVNGVAVPDNSLYDFLRIAHGTRSTVDNLGGLATADADIFRIRYMSHAFKIPVVGIDSPTIFSVDQTDADYASLQQWQIVGISNCSDGAVFMLTSAPVGGVISVAANTPSPRGIYNVSADLGVSDSNTQGTQYYLYGGSSGAYEYFVGNAVGGDCTVADEQCALYRRAGGAAEELVQGVHDMEVMYGSTDATTGNLTFLTAAAVTAADNWANVDRFRVTLTFNSIENAQTQGNNVSQLLTKTASQTFNLYNQL